MSETFLVSLGFAFGFVSGALAATLVIGWLAWRAIRGIAQMGAKLRETQGTSFSS
jgi:hypothetical protein